MSNPVTVTVSLDVKPERVEELLAVLPRVQAETRSRPGVQVVRALRDPDRPTRMIFFDIFESLQASEDYFAWRGARGDLDWLGTFLSTLPRVESWPITLEPATPSGQQL